MRRREIINTVRLIGTSLLISVGVSVTARAQIPFTGGPVNDGRVVQSKQNNNSSILQEWRKLHQELIEQYDLLDRSNSTLEEIKESNAKIQELTETIEAHIKEIKESMIGPIFEDLASAGADGEDARNKLADIYRQDSSGLGLGLSNSEASLEVFSDQYGFLTAQTLYQAGGGLYAQRPELSDIVFFAGFTVQEPLDDM
jgi:hypothetical protein